MANEITFGFPTGFTLTYGAYQPDGTVRTAAGTSLPEIAGTGYYTATDGSIQAQDLVVIKSGTNVVGFGEYKPEVSASDTEAYILSDVIGTASDTLETLSDQADAILAAQQTVLNVYDEIPEATPKVVIN